MKDLLELLKMPAYLLGALAIASGILLFSPDNIISMLYMTEFRTNYGFGIGITFTLSFSILVVLLLKLAYKGLKDKYDIWQLKKSQNKFLMKLNNQKVGLIKEFIKQPTHTVILPMHDGLVLELQHFVVISPAGQTHMISMDYPQIPYFLQPWVIERINENEELKKKFNI